MEEPAFLLAMQLVVCHIQVQHDSLRPPRVIVQERFDEELFDPLTVNGNLLGPIGVPEPFTGLQPIERALAGTGLALVPRVHAAFTAGIFLTAQRGKQWIEAQHVMVDDIFISQAQAHDLLADQILHAMLDETLVAVIHKASGELTHQIRRKGEFAKEQPAGIRADHAPIKSRDNFSGSQVLKTKQVRRTVCVHRLAFLSRRKLLLARQLYRSERPFHSRSMRNSG